MTGSPVRHAASCGCVLGFLVRISAALALGAAFVLELSAVPRWGEAASARPWPEIVQSGRLRVAVQDQLPPLAWREGNGQRQGLEIELARALATQMLGDPNAIEWVPVRNRDRIAAVTQNEVDLAIAQLGITADRLRSVSFSTPYYLDGTAIVVPAGATPQTATDLTDETIAVLKGSSAVPTLNAALPNLTLVGVDSYQEGVAALQKGQVEGLAADASVLVGWIGDRSDYRLLKPLLSGVGLAIAMPKGNQYAELRRRVHQQMQTWADSEWLEQRAAAWGLP